ncbi:hypothetical protein ALC57_09113 [Trachymyrmex cornetzi]|uniref:Uncharacterized protein n=1 Tax=Trachymyrmex cornetzi TaxID=471704 RepID=A0A151J5R2_9HYME|nr:hypothetical protein ALC57_09113 [Trachymyrmex cornetzi]
MLFLTYLIGFSGLAGAMILYWRVVILLAVKTPISLLATFSLRYGFSCAPVSVSGSQFESGAAIVSVRSCSASTSALTSSHCIRRGRPIDGHPGHLSRLQVAVLITILPTTANLATNSSSRVLSLAWQNGLQMVEAVDCSEKWPTK